MAVVLSQLGGGGLYDQRDQWNYPSLSTCGCVLSDNIYTQKCASWKLAESKVHSGQSLTLQRPKGMSLMFSESPRSSPPPSHLDRSVISDYTPRHLSQLVKSSYMFFFQLPRLPELVFSMHDFKVSGVWRAYRGFHGNGPGEPGPDLK